MRDDAATLIAWTREAADELERAHYVLDILGAPRTLREEETQLSLAARIRYAFGLGLPDTVILDEEEGMGTEGEPAWTLSVWLVFCLFVFATGIITGILVLP